MSGTGALARAADSATGPVEVAVVLESEGINDRVARERTGKPLHLDELAGGAAVRR